MSLTLGMIPADRQIDIYQAALASLRENYMQAVAVRDRQRFVMFDLLVDDANHDTFDLQMASMVVKEKEVNYFNELMTAMQLKMLGLFSG